jgi:hypothetical protein
LWWAGLIANGALAARRPGRDVGLAAASVTDGRDLERRLSRSGWQGQRFERRDRYQLNAAGLRQALSSCNANSQTRECAGSNPDTDSPQVAPADAGLSERLFTEREQALGVAGALTGFGAVGQLADELAIDR